MSIGPFGVVVSCGECGLAHAKGELVICVAIVDGVPVMRQTCQSAGWTRVSPLFGERAS